MKQFGFLFYQSSVINSQREAKSGFKGFKSGKILEHNNALKQIVKYSTKSFLTPNYLSLIKSPQTLFKIFFFLTKPKTTKFCLLATYNFAFMKIFESWLTSLVFRQKAFNGQFCSFDRFFLFGGFFIVFLGICNFILFCFAYDLKSVTGFINNPR